MKPFLFSRSLHKWLALFVGLQLLVWAVTGFFMVAVDLDFIHGDSLVRNLRHRLWRWYDFQWTSAAITSTTR